MTYLCQKYFEQEFEAANIPKLPLRLMHAMDSDEEDEEEEEEEESDS
jgi:hypothetical protein